MDIACKVKEQRRPMPQAIVLNELGGPEKLVTADVPHTKPARDELLIRHDAIGVNYIDTYFREGLYGTELPAIIGDQAVGSIVAMGKDVSGFAVGEQVAYTSVFGAYCAERCLSAAKVVKIPPGIEPAVIAATLTRGLTAEYLLRRLHEVSPSDTIIIHAAAGGTGVILTQWAKALGATIIGTVGDESKFALAQNNGCDHVLNHQDPDFITRIQELTDGRLADVVYDSIGKTTFETSIRCLKPRGLMVAYGNASGKPEALEVLDLARLGSLFLTRPIMSHYIGTRAELELSTRRYFEVLSNGTVTPPAQTHFALADAPDAHRHLEDRSKLSVPVLVPA